MWPSRLSDRFHDAQREAGRLAGVLVASVLAWSWGTAGLSWNMRWAYAPSANAPVFAPFNWGVAAIQPTMRSSLKKETGHPDQTGGGTS